MRHGTELGRVRGLGSAHGGTHDWILMRLTSAASLVLCVFLLVSFILLPDYSWVTLRSWLARPVPATAMVLLVIATFWHTRLGVAELIGDYVHDAGNKFAALLALNLVAAGGAVFGVVSIARIAFAGIPA